MPPKSRFTRLDAFTKTVDEARIRTTSGGIVTIVSLLVVLFLSWGEWAEYRRIDIHPELIVDKGRGERMEIHLNITFPKMPCELLTLDVMDVSGEQQHGVMHGVNKVRLQPANQGGAVIDSKSLALHDESADHLDPSYCGGCYGAQPPANGRKPGCCQTCDEVREAYAQSSWAFGRGEGVEQCEREHYGEKLDAQREEGCRIEGGLRVNKVIGNFHFAPGRSFSSGNMHVHDLKNYWDVPKGKSHDFTHYIHSLRFGPQLPDNIAKKVGTKSSLWTNHHQNPLDNTRQEIHDPNFNFMYFVKIVPTSYLPLGWDSKGIKIAGLLQDDNAGLGAYGYSEDGSVETHQYSVTSHKRSLAGGNDAAEGHAERQHTSGGIPGVFFSYDISPMKVVNREEKAKTFSGFLAGLCAIVGGTLTVAAAVDRGLFEGAARIKKMRTKDQ
ncbi:endoplasmic reticulum vesicle transporter-domain-containing protein [Fusarium redolens]|uniref:Endoplasmic reticulum-Golgi intermediate compartment protein n=1 Tax=Fusarium redolens TaxID=48865 RepID=A0A9P9KWD9_FUSRE|nr:endoplasmic reticulum vesicle transporter-domain-containing protein [Fusarium redolens]KAH7269792.1 endoplasmic reticulum vesicle transporter-domain-containing protein [Fusarium redolens]